MRTGLRAGRASDVDDLGAGPGRGQFARWFADAAAAGVAEPNAMVLATADADGAPGPAPCCSRGTTPRASVLHQPRLGKGGELAANPRAALVFPWHALERQVRVVGAVVEVDRAEVEAYFATRPRGSQLGAWASAAVVGGAARGLRWTQRWRR